LRVSFQISARILSATFPKNSVRALHVSDATVTKTAVICIVYVATLLFYVSVESFQHVLCISSVLQDNDAHINLIDCIRTAIIV